MAGVFGLRGELKVAASRIGDDALAAGMDVRATLRDGSSRALRVRSLRRHQGRPLIAFDGVDDANAAEALVGATLAIDRAAVRLARGEYFDEDLVGCALVDAAGAQLAEVVAVEHYPAQDMLLVVPGHARDETQRAIVPLVRAFVKRVDVGAKRIVVELPPGLLDARDADEA
ncbi:MAG TPA: ribosome maturation factor RimM [Candidatus Elarobacter sp.]|nr:ribosome maturation factor RimM [Dongiaceae bacterium]HZW54442.1 ribosome maturation factor RimM [Candidatus Elarobacter sp.]